MDNIHVMVSMQWRNDTLQLFLFKVHNLYDIMVNILTDGLWDLRGAHSVVCLFQQEMSSTM